MLKRSPKQFNLLTISIYSIVGKTNAMEDNGFQLSIEYWLIDLKNFHFWVNEPYKSKH